MTSLPAGRADAYPHAADLALIPLATGSDLGVAHFVLTADLTRHDGALYGGTGAAAAIGMINSVGNLGGLVSSPLIGWLKDHTDSTGLGMYMIAGFVVISAVLALGFPAQLVNK